jgi:hypothetical protein
MSGPGTATIFEAMTQGMNTVNAPCSLFNLDFQHPDDVVDSDHLIPTITLSLRPATAHEEQRSMQS